MTNVNMADPSVARWKYSSTKEMDKISRGIGSSVKAGEVLEAYQGGLDEIRDREGGKQ